RCVECHGAAKQQGDLRLDLRSQVLGAKGDDGLVVAGNPDDSRLIQVILHDPNDTQMPPDNKLSDQEIQVFTEWVRRGAYWPENDQPAAAEGGIPKLADGSIDFSAAAALHWAYRPIVLATPPVVESTTPITPLDQFIRA